MRLLPIALVAAALIVVPLAAQDVPLPQPRPDAAPETPIEPGADASPEAEAAAEPADVTPGREGEIAAEPEAPRVYQTACPAVLMGRVEAEALPPIAEGVCGEQSPLRVTGVLVRGRMVPLTTPAVVNCEMASTLPDWAEAIDGYLVAKENTRLSGIVVGTSYMCRNRNNAETGDISEHGFANAFDVVGVTLEDGRSVSVKSGWPDALSSEGRLLRFAHDSACSLFTTTLGPEANELHYDHLHLDLGCHGGTCTARLCQ